MYKHSEIYNMVQYVIKKLIFTLINYLKKIVTKL